MKKLYGELAKWWPVWSPPEHYTVEAAFFAQVLAASGVPASGTLLELGSGGGHNAFHLKKRFARLTLTDLSPSMLEVSRALNPECEHVEGDMRSLRLGRRFACIFAHDAIDYMTTRGDLSRAFETAYVHCSPGGVALFVPDHVRETFEVGTELESGEVDGRALRCLAWTHDSDERDTQCTVEYVMVLRDRDEPVRVVHETHVYGLFARDEWLALLRAAGFEPEIIRDPDGRDLFLARKPAS